MELVSLEVPVREGSRWFRSTKTAGSERDLLIWVTIKEHLTVF